MYKKVHGCYTFWIYSVYLWHTNTLCSGCVSLRLWAAASSALRPCLIRPALATVVGVHGDKRPANREHRSTERNLSPRGFSNSFAMAPPDPHSFADPAQARTQSVALDLTVDFETQTIHGTALLKLDKQVIVYDRREEWRKEVSATTVRIPTVLRGWHRAQARPTGDRERRSLPSSHFLLHTVFPHSPADYR